MFFFKQKTAYEMRISDWSSDVCSSDLGRGQEVDVSMFEHMVHFNLVEHLFGATFQPPVGDFGYTRLQAPDRRPIAVRDGYVGVMPYTEAHWRRFFAAVRRPEQIGRASRRERVCQVG